MDIVIEPKAEASVLPVWELVKIAETLVLSPWLSCAFKRVSWETDGASMFT